MLRETGAVAAAFQELGLVVRLFIMVARLLAREEGVIGRVCALMGVEGLKIDEMEESLCEGVWLFCRWM